MNFRGEAETQHPAEFSPHEKELDLGNARKPRMAIRSTQPTAQIARQTSTSRSAATNKVRTGNPALQADLEKALTEYHSVHGEKNGSSVPGPIYPPGVKKTPAELEKFIKALATHLSAEPNIELIAFPEKEGRKEARQAYAAKESEYVRTHIQAYLERGTDLIQSPEVRKLVEQARAKAPKEFYIAPSSSSGRYHPADEINEGGLALHSYRSAVMADVLAKYFGLDAEQRDLVVAGALLHDINKGGTPWQNYARDHGPQGQKWLDDTWTGETKTEKSIESLVGNHMAQWNWPTATPAKDLLNLIVSYADYLGSQDSVYVKAHPLPPARKN
jgi:hypothetical protein